jgi:predicted metal-dependent peptidase
MTFDLNKHIYRLLQDEPFFAALSRRIDKKSTRSIPTAGVSINKHTGYYELLYNPDYIETLTDREKCGVLKHEFYHLIFEHITDRLPDGKMSILWNVATDLAINSHIRTELPEGCCIPGEGEYLHYPPSKTSEWYYDVLKKEHAKKQDGQSADGQKGAGAAEDGKGEGSQSEGESGPPTSGQFDSHESWGDADQQTKEIAKERLKDMTKKAAEECDKTNSWGSVSRQVREHIKENLIGASLDWKKLLRYFVRTSQVANKRSSIKNINRRYPYIHPGKNKQRQARIAISIDQSGSVSDSLLDTFFLELAELSKIAEFVVVPFDDEVFESEVFVWKRGETRKNHRVLRGGTNFDAPTKYVNENNFDGHIILTDMYAPKPGPSKCQRVWVTDAAGARAPYFTTKEKVLVLK